MKKYYIKSKSESGVTLMMLAITILVLLILAGSSLFIGLNSISKIDDKNETATLYMIQEVVMGQYSKAKINGQTGIKIDTSHLDNRPSVFFGQMLMSISDIPLPAGKHASDIFAVNYNNTTISNFTYDQVYYLLRPEELSMLGITDVVIEVQGATSTDRSIQYRNLHTYVVNYSTGEVYDVTDKVDSNNELLYCRGNIGNNSEISNVLKDKTYNFDDNF